MEINPNIIDSVFEEEMKTKSLFRQLSQARSLFRQLSREKLKSKKYEMLNDEMNKTIERIIEIIGYEYENKF